MEEQVLKFEIGSINMSLAQAKVRPPEIRSMTSSEGSGEAGILCEVCGVCIIVCSLSIFQIRNLGHFEIISESRSYRHFGRGLDILAIFQNKGMGILAIFQNRCILAIFLNF